MNRLLEDIIVQRGGHYCHCIEVSSMYDIESVISAVLGSYGDQYTETEYIEFFDSIQVIYMNEDEEEEGLYSEEVERDVYSFDMRGYIQYCM